MSAFICFVFLFYSFFLSAVCYSMKKIIFNMKLTNSKNVNSTTNDQVNKSFSSPIYYNTEWITRTLTYHCPIL